MERSEAGELQTATSTAMQAGVLHGRRDVRVEAVPRPRAGHGQVLLRVLRAGLCGSDIHYFVHGCCGRFVPSRPFVLGHEFVATVENVGEGVTFPAVGERVVVNPASSCGQCPACRAGRANLCEDVVMLGSASTTPPRDGAFAEFVSVPAHQCHAIPRTMSDSDAAMIEPLAVALHATSRAPSLAGKRVLVTGGGPIGLLTARAARALGAARVVISEPAPRRREAATRLAADASLDPLSADFVAHALAESEGGFDMAFEASGAAAAVRSSFDVVRRGGTIVQIGTIAAGEVALPVNELMVREIALVGSFRYADEFAAAIRLVAAGRITFDGLVTAVLPMQELAAALALASDSPESLKVHVVNA